MKKIKRIQIMSLQLNLSNKQISAYLNTEDALLALQKSVDNNQTRLAMQIMADVIEQLCDKVSDLQGLVLKKDKPAVESTPKQMSKTKEEVVDKLENDKK